MDGQQAREKMFNITNYQRNANQNHKENDYYQRMTTIKKTRNNKYRRGCGEKGALLVGM